MKIWKNLFLWFESRRHRTTGPEYLFLTRATGKLTKKSDVYNRHPLEVKIRDVGVTRIYCDVVVWTLLKEGDEVPIIYSRDILNFSAYLDLQNFKPGKSKTSQPLSLPQ